MRYVLRVVIFYLSGALLRCRCPICRNLGSGGAAATHDWGGSRRRRGISNAWDLSDWGL